MDFSLSKETKMIKESARQFLSKKADYNVVKDIINSKEGYSQILWKEICELGWPGLLYEEKYGGSHGSFLEMFSIFEEIGRVLLPSPLFSSALLSGLLVIEGGNEDLKNEIIPPLVLGEKILTTALLNEYGGYWDHDLPLKATLHEDAVILNGTNTLVPYANVANEVIVKGIYESDKPTLFRIDPQVSDIKLIQLETMSNEKLFTIIMRDTRIPRKNIIGAIGKANNYIDAILPKVIVCKCAEMLGGLEVVVANTVAYAKERHQFGRPIGTLQIIQHHCATMATYLEGSRLLAYQAASMLSDGDDCPKEIAMAKSYLNQAYKESTWLSHQIYGGIGFTDEYPVHLYYKHAKASELDYGSSWFHKQEIADQMAL